MSCLEEKWDKFMLNDNRPWIVNFMLNTFDKMIPTSGWVKDFKDIPSFPMYIMAFWFNLMWWGVFTYFITTSYVDGVENSYISLDPSSGDCSEVPFIIDGTYLADSSGHWESMKKFSDATALYRATYLGYQSNTTEYQDLFLSTIATDLKRVGAVASRRDLAFNLIAWTAYSYKDNSHGKFMFAPVGEIAVMLNKYYFNGGMANSGDQIKRGELCLNHDSATTFYDLVGGAVKFGYPIDNSSSPNATSPECLDFASALGYDPSRGPVFSSTFNLNSFASAVAVNYDIIRAQSLVEIKDDPKRGYVYESDDGTGFDDNFLSGGGGGSPGNYYTFEDDFFKGGGGWDFYGFDDDYFSFTDDWRQMFDDDAFSFYYDDSVGYDDDFGMDDFNDDDFDDDDFSTDDAGFDDFSTDDAGFDDFTTDDAGVDDFAAGDDFSLLDDTIRRKLTSKHDGKSSVDHVKGKNHLKKRTSRSRAQTPKSEVDSMSPRERRARAVRHMGKVVNSRNQHNVATKGSVFAENMALQQQLKSKQLLEGLDSKSSDFTVEEVDNSALPKPSPWRRFYDPKYLTMDPIHCLTFIGWKSSSCFLQLFINPENTDDVVYAYPIIKHWSGTNCDNASVFGDSWYNSVDPLANATWLTMYDHTIDILLGLIVFDNMNTARDFGITSFLTRRNITDGDLTIPNMVYPSMLAMMEMDSEGFNATNVCGISSTTKKPRNCFLMTFNSYGPGFYINNHDYQLFAGACRDSLFNNQTLTYLGKGPPQPLIQIYYQCVMKPYDSFFNALGLSLGNADVYAKWAFYVSMIIFLIYMRCSRGFDAGMGVFISVAQEERNNGKNDGGLEMIGSYDGKVHPV